MLYEAQARRMVDVLPRGIIGAEVCEEAVEGGEHHQIHQGRVRARSRLPAPVPIPRSGPLPLPPKERRGAVAPDNTSTHG